MSSSARASTSASRRASLVFTRELHQEGKLGFWRWASIVFGVAGTYRQNDVVDVIYEAPAAAGRSRAAFRSGPSAPAATVAARSRSACSSVSCPGSSRHVQLPCSRRACSSGPRCRARARPGAGSCERGPRRERQLDQPPRLRGAGSGRAACRCRASSCRSPAARGGSRTGAGWSPRPWNAQRRTTIPGKPRRSRSALTSGVIMPRSSAITGSGPSSASAASKTAAPGPGSQRPERASRARLRDRPELGEAAEVVDAGQVEERQRPAQALDPPAVAVARDGVPVEERIAPVLAERAEPVGRRPGDEPRQEEVRVRAVVDAALGDVDRDVADQPDAALGGVRAQRRPLAVEANLVVDAPARAPPSPRSRTRSRGGTRPARAPRRARPARARKPFQAANAEADA